MSTLPFQWDDGNFISPFVAASEEDMEMLAEYLVSRYLSSLTALADAHANSLRRFEMRITDLGCGDATALLSLAQYIRKGWRELGTTVEGSAQSSLQLLLTGVDLDETLLSTAEDNAALFANSIASPTSSPVSVEAHFVCADIRFADVDVYFPRHLSLGGAIFSAAAATPYPPFVLYMYLLPDALVLLREKLLTILKRGWIIASNRWPIPGLEGMLTDRVGHVHIYRQ